MHPEPQVPILASYELGELPHAVVRLADDMVSTRDEHDEVWCVLLLSFVLLIVWFLTVPHATPVVKGGEH